MGQASSLGISGRGVPNPGEMIRSNHYLQPSNIAKVSNQQSTGSKAVEAERLFFSIVCTVFAVRGR